MLVACTALLSLLTLSIAQAKTPPLGSEQTAAHSQGQLVLASDTLAPVGRYELECGGSVGARNEAYFMDLPGGSSSKIAYIGMLADSSYNYSFSPIDFFPGTSVFAFFVLKVDNQSERAHAILIAKDGAGNVFMDTIDYFPPKIRIEPAVVSIERSNTARSDTVHAQLVNDGTTVFPFMSFTPAAMTDDREQFYVESDDRPIMIGPGEHLDFLIVFREKVYADYTDRILVADTCVSVTMGDIRVHYPRVLRVGAVEHMNAHLNTLDSRPCQITNDASIAIRIDSIGFLSPTSAFSIQFPPTYPYILGPSKDLSVLVGFRPKTAGDFSDSLIVYSNAERHSRSVEVRGTGYIDSDVLPSESANVTASPLDLRYCSSSFCSFVRTQQQDADVLCTMYDALGRVCWTQRVEAGAEGTNVVLRYAPQPVGAYTLRLSASNGAWLKTGLVVE